MSNSHKEQELRSLIQKCTFTIDTLPDKIAKLRKETDEMLTEIDTARTARAKALSELKTLEGN